MNKEMRSATAPHRYKNRSATRKEPIVYNPITRVGNLEFDRYMNLQKFMMMIQADEPTGEMFLRAKFTGDNAFILLTAIAERMKAKAREVETVAVNTV